MRKPHTGSFLKQPENGVDITSIVTVTLTFEVGLGVTVGTEINGLTQCLGSFPSATSKAVLPVIEKLQEIYPATAFLLYDIWPGIGHCHGDRQPPPVEWMRDHKDAVFKLRTDLLELAGPACFVEIFGSPMVSISRQPPSTTSIGSSS